LGDGKIQKENSKTKERLDICLSAGNLAWWEMDVKTGKVIFNENKVKMLGYSKNDFKDVDYTAFTDLVHPDDYEKTMQAMRDHLEGKKKLYEVDYRIKTKKGSYKWFHDRGSIVERNQKSEPLTVKGIVFDITDLKEKEKELEDLNKNLENVVSERTKDLENSNKKLKEEIVERRKAEEYSNRTKQNLRNIIDSTTEFIVSFDMNNRVSIWNKTAENITGYKQIEVLNRSIGKLEVFENPDIIVDNIKVVCGKNTQSFIDIFLKTKENDKRIIRVTGTEIKSSDNECVGVLFLGNDITEEIDLHKKLLGGNSYLIRDKYNKSSIDLLMDLTIDDFKGLIITRGNPDQIKRQVPLLKNIKIIILTSEDIKGIVGISSLEELKNEIEDFAKKTKKSVILLDGIHYLLSRFSFNEFVKYLYDINDIISKNKAIIFVRIDPSTIDTNQIALLENELLVLPSQKTEDLIIEDDLFDIVKYVYEQNELNAVVSFKKVMSKFNIAYVTAATRLDNLEKTGLVYFKKQGKIKAVYITEKGKNILHKRKSI
jgi:PAS domain S-box-containing protein